MSEDNRKLVAELYDALRRKDTKAMAALSSPDISVHQSTGLPWGGVYVGIGEALQFFGKVSSFLDSSVTVDNMLDAGEYVVVVGHTAGTVKATRKPFQAPLVHLWGIRDQKITSLAVFLHHPAILPQLS